MIQMASSAATSAATASGSDAELIVDLLQIHDARLVGRKAAALARAAASGAQVPGGVVITTSACGLGFAAIERQLAARLERNSATQRFAVRSSAAAEDGATHSFAGQLETVLDVPREGVRAAIEHCWASAQALRALRYGADAGPIAVIVQDMVPAEAAGVAFSAEPRTGERGVVVLEAVTGLGDQLVSGARDPESWRVEAAGARRTRAPGRAVLDAPQAQLISALAREMEGLFGCPQDIEWAWSGGELFLLQSRPITALPAAPIALSSDPPAGGWDRDDHHAVLSPLGWSWFQPYPTAMAACMRQVGVPVEAVEITRIAGHLYMRFKMSGPESTKLPPRWVLWLASRVIPSMRRGNRLAAEFLDQETYMRAAERWRDEWRPELRRRISELFIEQPSSLSDGALLTRIEDALALTATGLRYHAELGGPGMFSFGKLSMFAEDKLGWSAERVRSLVAGTSAKTTELHRQIEAIVREHKGELESAGEFPRSFASLAARCPGLARALGAWLHDNQLRMLHYDPKHATLGERPDYVLSIAQNIAHDLRGDQPAPEQGDDAAQALLEASTKLGPTEHAELERLLEQARSVHGLRDENGIETVSRPAGLLRHFVLELGRRLQDRIGQREHAVYLYPEEHGPALRGELADLSELIERRRGEESWAEQNRPPKRIGPPAPPMPPADVFPSGLARVMRILGAMMKGEETPAATDGGELRGIGLGTRIVSGRARVIGRPEELATLRHGEILVCRITSPEWSVGLGRVAGIVSNEGGALSHPAIIAREFGVPAVLGVANATRDIDTGDLLQLDPVAGIVTILEGRSRPAI